MHSKFKMYALIMFFFLKIKTFNINHYTWKILVYKYDDDDDDDDDVNFLKNISIRTELNNKSTNNTCYIFLIMCI